MQPLQFTTAATLEDALGALGALAGADGQTALLAGGTDLIIQWRAGRRPLRQMVELKKIPELNVLEFDPARGLRLGAAVACHRLAEFEPARRHYRALVEGAALIGSTQIQSRASVGGNVCNASPAADAICGLIVHEARCLVRGPKGSREVLAKDFMLGPGRSALQPGELLVELRLPPPPPRSASGYLRFIPRNEMDIAVVGAGAWLAFAADGKTCTAARVALGAVGPTPYLVDAAGAALIGSTLDEPALRAAAEAATEAARPITDVRGTAEYRRHMAGVLTRRAILRAAQAARQSTRETHA
ncbi:MAG: FAD binding domain-containing protein [Candidatus Lambdaproteobacteria bacterium]|nr:FAD binding domain-containing protein [Candidatus Lambdaproteobacteria bacterium]